MHRNEPCETFSARSGGLDFVSIGLSRRHSSARNRYVLQECNIPLLIFVISAVGGGERRKVVGVVVSGFEKKMQESSECEAASLKDNWMSRDLVLF